MKLNKKYEVGSKIATREAYGDALAEFGAEFPLVVLDADLSKSTKTATFQKAFPDRHINCGIAEANMISIAAGLASTGKIPFASSFAMFAAGRAFEQVRNSVGYPHLNVKIGATHAGITVGEDGETHQCNEDLSLMRVIPGMCVINPCDAAEARAAVRAAIEHNGPVYLRFGRLAVEVIHDENNYEFTLGKGEVLAESDKDEVTLIGTGMMVQVALEAKKMLEEKGITARVINIHTIKPLDVKLIEKAARETGAIVTAEEHSVIGGLGSAVAEAISETCPVPLARVGVQDTFGASGPAKELLGVYGLDAKTIVEKALDVLSRK